MTRYEILIKKTLECQFCGIRNPEVKYRRRMSQYADDELNWIKSCVPCSKEDDEHFKELWEEYWSSIRC